MCGISFRPVFVDLVWEYNRSPLISLILCLRWLQFMYIFFLGGIIYELFDPSLTCSAVLAASRGESESDVDSSKDIATTVFFFMFILSSCFASSRAHSRAWTLPALLSSLVYLGLTAGTQLPACSTLISQNIGDPSGIVSVVLHVLDAFYTSVMIAALTWLCLEDPPALLSGIDREAYVFRVRDFLSRNYVKIEDLAWSTRARYGVFVAPMRHIVSTILALIFCVTATIVAGVASGIYKNQQIDLFQSLVSTFHECVNAYNSTQPIFDQLPTEAQELFHYAGTLLGKMEDGINDWGFPLITAVSDALWSLSAGAVIACVMIVASLSATFAAIYDDHVAISKVTFSAASSASPDGTTVSLIQKGTGDQPGEAARPPSCCARFWSTSQAFLADGTTINIAGPSFSYMSAASYTALYLINIMTVWLLTTVIVGFVIFFFTSTATAALALNTIFALLVSVIWNRISACLYRRYVADGNVARSGYAVILIDFILSATTGIATGLSAGLVRFFLGIAHLLFCMTMLNKPILPRQFALYDSGFVAHAGMMKAAWAWELDPEALPRQTGSGGMQGSLYSST